MSDVKVIKSAHHRNGSVGAPFCVTIFQTNDPPRRFIGITFDKRKGHYAVLDLDLAAQGTIEFGRNSWRAQEFVDELPSPTDPE